MKREEGKRGGMQAEGRAKRKERRWMQSEGRAKSEGKEENKPHLKSKDRRDGERMSEEGRGKMVE